MESRLHHLEGGLYRSEGSSFIHEGAIEVSSDTMVAEKGICGAKFYLMHLFFTQSEVQTGILCMLEWVRLNL